MRRGRRRPRFGHRVPRAPASAKLVKGAVLKVYAGAPHGLTATHKDRVNADLLEFVRS